MITATAQSGLMARESVAVTTGDGEVRLFPGWHGPAKAWVSGRGAAYQYGVFALSPDTLAFAGPRGEVFHAPRRNTTISWPWWTGRIIAHLRLPGGERHAVAFGRPFPDAPDGDSATTGAAVDQLRLRGVLPVSGQPFLHAAALVGDLVALASTVTDLAAGLRRARAVRAALAAA
ncbi:MAG: hypothetical protein IRZ08_11215 [Frankia sp.]|nr:hypothetical protein [Frankia sp.]